MSIKPAEKYPLNKVTYAVRAAQAVLQYGVGAMVDFKDQTLMTAAPEYWASDTVTIHDERLERVLKVNKFGMPTGEDGHRIAYARFPEWYFCPKCRRFKPIRQWVEEYRRKGRKEFLDRDPYMVNHMRCPSCNQSLVVARIVSVCKHGHISDFPWVEWVHSKNMTGAKKICMHPDIRFKTGSSATEGLEGLIVTCESCKARASLKGAFDPNAFERIQKQYNGEFDFTCKGQHPWKNKKEACEEFPRAMQRGSSSVYFPVTASSLVIPPYSSNLTEKVENSVEYQKYQNTINDMKMTPGISEEIITAMLTAQIGNYSNKIAIEINEPEEKVEEILRRKINTEEVPESTLSIMYRAEEYDALSGRVVIPRGLDRDFIREGTDISQYSNLPYVTNVSLINKIREVQALIGFSRIKPADPSESPDKQSNLVCVKEPKTDWYPAYQVRGEGIFIEFDNDAVRRWAENEYLTKRIDIINDNYKHSFMADNRPRVITAKFVLLHTLSHLLIRQLSFECGYSIASLKERIYCGEEDEGKEMAGIFIYTASGDAEGTMGGLVRQGRPDTFPRIYNKALKSAVNCSNDPVCNLSLGQGRDSLNLSACYSCALIPETSCEEFNMFLDRGCVVGTFNSEGLGFYEEYLSSEKQATDHTNQTEKSEPVQNVKKVRWLHDITSATDLSDSDYSSIWRGSAEWSDNETELSLLTELSKHAEELKHKEKPYRGAYLFTTDGSERIDCELLWVESKVVFFTAEDEEAYKIAKSSNWKCFCGSDPTVTATMIIESIKEV